MPKENNNTPLKKGLPESVATERMILGSILLDDSKFSEVTGAITTEVFALENHRRIWIRMGELAARSEKIDRVTVANELMRYGELAGDLSLSYLVDMDSGLPEVSSLDAYVRIVVEKWRLRKLAAAAQKIMTQVLSGECTADDVALNGQTYLTETGSGYGTSQAETAREFVESYPGGINLFLDPSRANPGTPTGFADIDGYTDGFHAGEIFIVAARPASGKTAIGCNIAKNVARNDKRVVIFSMELSKTMLLHRLICEEAYVAYSRFRRGEMDDDQRARVRAATSTIMDLPLYIDDTSGLRVSDMRVKLNKILRDGPVGLIVADYAQLIKPPKGIRFNTENDKFTLVGEEIKILTKETGVPMLLLSQLNRESEKDRGDNRPKLSQARGAGIWEEIAFVGACLYREYLRKKERADLREQAEFLIEKNRSGSVANVKLRFQPWLMRFGQYDGGSPAAEETAA